MLGVESAIRDPPGADTEGDGVGRQRRVRDRDRCIGSERARCRSRWRSVHSALEVVLDLVKPRTARRSRRSGSCPRSVACASSCCWRPTQVFDETSNWLRRVAIVLVLTLAAAAVYLTVVLSVELIAGENVTGSADELLASGTLIWLGNNVMFALLYWLFDDGGALLEPSARGDIPTRFPSTRTPSSSSRLATGSAITSISARPTRPRSAPPTSHRLPSRAKIAMAFHALISLMLLPYVIATAVNLS